jgi:hypothetical protein
MLSSQRPNRWHYALAVIALAAAASLGTDASAQTVVRSAGVMYQGSAVQYVVVSPPP